MQPTNEVARSGRAFAWLTVLLGGAVLALYVFAVVMVVRLGPQSRQPGWTAARANAVWRVRTVDANGPAGGKLRANDVILAIDDDARFSVVDPALKLRSLAPGATYSIQTLRGGVAREARLELPQRRDSSNVAWFLSLLVAGLTFFTVAGALGLARPATTLTRVGCIASLVTSAHICGLILAPIAPLLSPNQQWISAAAGVVAPWHVALGYAFFSRFPSRVRESAGWKAAEVFIYCYCLLIFVPRTILNFVAASGEEQAIRFHLDHAGWIGLYQANAFGLNSGFKIVAAVATCLVLARNYRMLAGMPDQRRRIRWVIAAAGVGILLPGLFAVGMVAAGSRSMSQSGAYPANIIVTNLFSAVIPITLAYAALRYRVLGVNVVVRLGMQYLFARNSLRLFLLLPVLAIAWRIAAHPNHTVSQLVTESSASSYGFLILSAGVSLRYRRRLTSWLDSQFFREAYQQEVILLELIERLKLAESVPQILSLVGTQISEALHPRSIRLWCRQPGVQASSAASSSFGENPMPAAVDEQDMARIVSAVQTAIQLVPGQSGAPPETAAILGRLGARLVVPVKDSHQRPMGVMLLGEKRSEEPYTPSNVNLLRAIVSEMGIALELVWLRELVQNEQTMRNQAWELLDRKSLNLLRECPQCGSCFDTDVERCSLDGALLASPVLVERVIDGKYRLDQRIGHGAYGAVYEAADVRLKRSVAVKIVAGGLLAHDSAMRRFEREAQAAARLNHPNIIAVYDYGLARPQGAYLAMELIRGSTWRSELRRLGTIPPSIAAEWLDQLLAAVAAAHQEGIIHRDLKPENVLIVPGGAGPGSIKVLDFGLAKMRLLDVTDLDSLTLAGTVVGTLGYMSPEQFTGGEVDERSDIFALGVMTVEALSGCRPFRGRTPGELLQSLLNDPPLLKAEGLEGKKLNRVLRRALARKVGERYRTVNELRVDLVPLLRSCPAVPTRMEREEHTRTMTITG
jgi:hypothetical protein